MSKQLKFKFKKTLKKAEFVHADLEYHQELLHEAKSLFKEEIKNLIDKLSPEDQEKIKLEETKRHLQNLEALEAASKKQDKLKQIEDRIHEPVNESGCTELITTGLEPSDTDSEEITEKTKLVELKKLFRRIAEQTHPDKVKANGFSDKEVNRLERVFKKALQAYNDNNWYVLYSIAIDLDLKISAPTQEHINWIENDIRYTMGNIAQIGNLVAWIWYTGDLSKKEFALKDYFQQIYNFNYPDLQSHIQN